MNIKYKEYLLSDVWRIKKQEVYLRLQKKNQIHCYVCRNKSIKYDVHHRSYRRLGKERVSDLILLCRACHFGLHKWNPKIKVSFYRKPDAYRKYLRANREKSILPEVDKK